MESEKKGAYNISEEFLEEIRGQFKLWAVFLNTGIGLLSFTLALACLGTNTPWFNAILSMIIVVLVRQQGKHYFPNKIRELRKIPKENEEARILLKGLTSEFLSNKVIVTQYPLFLTGYLFLWPIIFSPFIVKYIPTLRVYFNL